MNKILRFLSISLLVPAISFAQSFQFAKGVGGTSFENAMGIALDSLNNIVVSGYFAGTADFDPSITTAQNLTSNGSNDVFLAKYDSAGKYIWAINIGGPNDEFTYADPVVDAGGNIYVCGLYGTTCDFDGSAAQAIIPNNGDNDGFIAKYDSAGNFQWAKGFGGTVNDDVYHIDLDANNDILFAGSFLDTADLNPDASVLNFISAGGAEVFFGKLDNTGSLVFVNVMNGLQDDRLYSITHDLNNDIILTGSFNDSIVLNPNGTSQLLTDANGLSSFVAKFSSLGSYQWAFALSKCLPFGLSVDHDNNILTSGQFSGPTDFDPGVNSKILSGQVGSYDSYLAKYTSNGNYIFANRFGGNQLDCAYAVHEMADSTIALTGFFNLTADFDPSITIASLTSAGAGDVFVARYDAGGNYISAFRCGSTGFDFIRNAVTDNAGDIFIAGGFDGIVDFDPGAPVVNLTSAGSRDAFFVKYGKPVTGITIVQGDNLNYSIYPNPFSGTLWIKNLSVGSEKIGITVFNSMGEIVWIEKEVVADKEIDLSALSKGVYYLQLTGEDFMRTEKLLKF